MTAIVFERNKYKNTKEKTMESTKKNLKITSILVLVFVGISLIDVITAIIFGDFSSVTTPEGAPENTLLIAKIVVLVLAGLLLLPQVYVGIKGLQAANAPVSTKAHIVWAKILFVFSVIALISPASELFKKGDTFENIADLLSTLVEVVLFFDYIRYAKALSK